jgi:Fe-S cluster biogenesis protein NfuA
VTATVHDNTPSGGIGRIEALIAALEHSADPETQAQARALVQAVLEFHGQALARLVNHITGVGAAGRELLEAAVRDDQVASLLLLHELHPHDCAARVAAALDRVRPQLKAHGGDVDLLGLEEGTVRLRLRGSCHGCPSSSDTLRNLIEAAVADAAPDVADIQVEGVVVSEDVVVPPLVTIGSSSPTASRSEHEVRR